MKKLECERKIKHWQGYGSVDAKVISKKSDELVIQVSGNHEYGLDCGEYDTDRVYEWLVKRFDPTKTERDIESVKIEDDYERVGNIDQEVCIYTIRFGDRDRWGGGRMWQESSVTLKEIEKGYGKDVRDALIKFCAKKKLSPDEVVNDETEDKNGMTLWDKFDVWAKNTLGLDIMHDYANGADWTVVGTGREEMPIYDDVLPARPMRESDELYHDFQPDEWHIIDFVHDELRDCEWILDMDYVEGRNPAIEMTVGGGKRYRIEVKPLGRAKD